MATVHILNKTPDHGRSARCLAQLRAGDCLVLLENGCYSLGLAAKLASEHPLYVLEGDLQARGLTQELPKPFQPIDYSGLVALTAAHDRVINW